MEIIDSLVLDAFGIQSILILLFYIMAIYDIFSVDDTSSSKYVHLRNVGYMLVAYPILIGITLFLSIVFNWGSYTNDHIIVTLMFLIPYCMMTYYGVDRLSRKTAFN